MSVYHFTVCVCLGSGGRGSARVGEVCVCELASPGRGTSGRRVGRRGKVRFSPEQWAGLFNLHGSSERVFVYFVTEYLLQQFFF